MNYSGKRKHLHRFGAAVLLASVSSSVLAVNDAPLTEKWAPSVGPTGRATKTPDHKLRCSFD